MKSVAIIGYGALGKILTSVVISRLAEDYTLVGIYDILLKQPNIEVNNKSVRVFESFEELLNTKVDIVVEIAGVGAVRELVIPLLQSGKHVVITSVGALADAELLAEITDTAKRTGCKVHVTSGAVGGFDILSTVSLMGNAVTAIESTKAPKSLNGAPYLEGKELPSDRRVIAFEGSAGDAIAGFPKNTNVAVATGIAGGGVDTVSVRVVSDPIAQGNTHRITIENDSARAVVEVTSKPDFKNPKSSVTAAWSVAGLLKNLVNPIQLF